MFQTGQWVVYGIHGVCRIVGTEKQRVNRMNVEYLVLAPLAQNEARFYLPTENPAAMAKLAPVLAREAWLALMESDTSRASTWIEEENLRKLRYRDLLNGCDRVALMQMVSTLYRYRDARAAAGRKFHQCDENFLHDAEKLLSTELALVLELPQDEARAYLRRQLG